MKISSDARLRGLIGGGTTEHFNKETREQRWAYYPRSFPPADIDQLFYSVLRLENDIRSGAIRPQTVDVFVNGQLVRLPDLQHKTGRSWLSILAEQIGDGAMVRVRELQDADFTLKDTVQRMERMLLAPCQANLYFSAGNGAGFPAHFDITDVFIVQCEGSKDWTIHKNYAGQVDLPTLDTPWEPTLYRPIGSGSTLVMNAGDVLYLPRGTMHTVQCGETHSLHLTISMETLTYADILVSEVRRLARIEPALRSRVPWTAEGDDEALTAVLRRHMCKLAEQVEAGPSIEAARRAFLQDGQTTPGVFDRFLSKSAD